MANVRKPRGRMYYYILMTRCAHCKFLKESCVKAFKPPYASGRYCIAKARNVIRHPVSGEITHRPGSFMLVDAGVHITVFCCPKNPELIFVSSTAFGAGCADFDPVAMHHRMPDGKKVKCK